MRIYAWLCILIICASFFCYYTEKRNEDRCIAVLADIETAKALAETSVLKETPNEK